MVSDLCMVTFFDRIHRKFDDRFPRESSLRFGALGIDGYRSCWYQNCQSSLWIVHAERHLWSYSPQSCKALSQCQGLIPGLDTSWYSRQQTLRCKFCGFLRSVLVGGNIVEWLLFWSDLSWRSPNWLCLICRLGSMDGWRRSLSSLSLLGWRRRSS